MLRINEVGRLYLGIQGENKARRITIDVSAWIDLYPNGSVTIWHKRHGESEPTATGAEYDSETQTVIWEPTSTDTYYDGEGEADIRLIENSVIKKSRSVITGVSPSVTLAGTTLGSDWQSYINAVDSLRAGAVVAQEAAEDAQEAAEDAQDAAEDAQEAAEAAQTAAETAQGKAEDAQEAAEDAQEAAEAAAGRAERASKVMVPEGGTAGQVLGKKSDDDFDMEWKTQPYYTKPAGGIPKTDLDSSVQESLGKADTALQGNNVAEAVDDWLDENITNPDSPPLDRSLSSSSAAAPADILGGLMAHESYGLTGSDTPTVEYDPVTADETVSGTRVMINSYDNVVTSTPTSTDMKIYPVTSGKTYKVIGYSDNTKSRPVLVVADSKVTSGSIATAGNYDYQLGTESSAQAQEIEYTALRTGYMYLNTNSSCGLWEKVVTPAASRKYYMDDIRNVNLPLITSGLNKSVFREKTDSASALIKQVPRNAECFAKVTSIADSVTLVRSIVSRNIVNKNNVGDVVVDAEGTEKVGIKTIHVPAGNYYVILGNVGNYTMVKKVENGIYTTLYKDQFPMKLGITDPAGGYFIVYASSLSNLGDVSGIMIGLLKDDESTLSFEAYSEKTYTPETLEVNPYIEVTPCGFIEFVNSGNADVSSTVKYLVSGKDDDTTTSKDFMVSPNGTKFLPMVKNDGTLSLARVVPKKALFIGNSLTSGWQTFGETATDSDNDFVANFSSYISTLDNTYTFSRKWATGFEQQTSLANAQSWTATNIDPLLTSDLDLIVVQLCENVVGNASMTATFPSSSLWLMQHLRETCPKARVVWMGLWFERGWTKTLLDNTKKAGCEYIDIRKLYTPENIGYIGLVYKMDSDYTKAYTVDSFVVDDGEITLTFTVDGTQYTATIPSYTSYESSSETSITVTGIYHVADTYYASIHPGDEGFRKIANKMLFDLGISDSEETITT